MPDTHIILTGFMGSGKSTVGRRLAAVLGREFIDLDAVIVEKAGRSINEIFARDGEPYFRSLESQCLSQVLSGNSAVVSGGGGVVIAEENRRIMLSKGVVINLTASLPVILDRLSGAVDRPLYSGEGVEDRVRRLLDERKDFYADANIRIDTDNKSVEDVVAEILKVLRELQA